MISVIIPLYNESKKMVENIHYILEYLNKYDYEMILVDDGSKDNTWELINELHKENNKIRGLRFSRNFGKEIALCAGVDSAVGDIVMTMDSDLTHDPKYIDDFIEEWKNGYKIVEGLRKERKSRSFIYKFFANLFYKILHRFSGLDLNKSLDYKLLDRQVVEEVKKMGDKSVFFRGLVEWVGYPKKQLLLDCPDRAGDDTSKFSIKGYVRLAVNAITSFSTQLLNMITILGVFFLIIAFVVGLYTLCNKLAGNGVDGLATVIFLILISSSCMLVSLGIIGTYIGKIYNEVKARPRYIVSEETK